MCTSFVQTQQTYSLRHRYAIPYLHVRTPKPTARPLPPDDRLFIRLPDNHPAKDMQPYAIYTSLRAQFGPNSSLLRDVQSIKTGFALCPTIPGDLSTIESHKDALAGYFGECRIERSTRWIAYRVTYIPRTFGQLIQNQYSLVPMDSHAMTSAIAEATGQVPVSVSETPTSAANPTSPFQLVRQLPGSHQGLSSPPPTPLWRGGQRSAPPQENQGHPMLPMLAMAQRSLLRTSTPLPSLRLNRTH